MKLADLFLKLNLDDMVKTTEGEPYELRFLLKIYRWSAKARKNLFKFDISDDELYGDEWEAVN